MIELNRIGFAYGQQPVLREISVSLTPGTFYGILGPNGCGKTTLVRLISGLLKPQTGTLLLDGKPRSVYSARQWARKISLMPQLRTLPPVCGEELVLRGRFPYYGLTGRPSSSDRSAVTQALAQAGAEALAHRNVTELSGGERQKVCFAMLLAQDAPFLMLDEPTTYLDLSHRFSLLDRLKDCSRQGKCVVAVLHDLSLALRYCDKILLLEDGTLRSFGSPTELLNQGVLDAVFGVRCLPVNAEGARDVIFLPRT